MWQLNSCPALEKPDHLLRTAPRIAFAEYVVLTSYARGGTAQL
jgi:hypothetical protein